ncbi:MAG: gas vesicle protein [Deltaproteobacteria bacterium]|nr:gas vesicle protein [Deltaproteobacteria bacterium]
MAIQALREDTIVDVIDRILDKGVTINADISISLCGAELLGIKIKAAIASFETAAKYGLEFPSGTDLKTAAWKNAMALKEDCPACKKKQPVESLLNSGCIWCGWRRAAMGDLTLTTP